MKSIVAGLVLTLIFLAGYTALSNGDAAEAQLDPGNFELYQDGVRVGEIFVPVRDRRARNYAEHWVLLPGYENPAPGGRTTEIRPVESRYQSLRDFFARVPFPDGSRYVVIGAHESARLPGR
jgi:hypothetical protein